LTRFPDVFPGAADLCGPEPRERLAYEQAMREAAVSKTRKELESLAKRVEKGRVWFSRKDRGRCQSHVLKLITGIATSAKSLSSGRFQFFARAYGAGKSFWKASS
jgi:hypothetical protein